MIDVDNAGKSDVHSDWNGEIHGGNHLIGVEGFITHKGFYRVDDGFLASVSRIRGLAASGVVDGGRVGLGGCDAELHGKSKCECQQGEERLHCGIGTGEWMSE